MTGIATALGPVLGGLITSAISWRGIFLVNVPVGILAIAVTVLRVSESRSPAAHRPDWAGFGLFTAGLGALVYGMIRAGQTSWGETGVIVCMILAVALLASFVLTERRVAHPMFDLSLFRTPTFLGGSIAALTMNGSLFAMFLCLVLYLQDILGLSALGVGLRLLILSGCSLVAAIAAGRLSARMPVRLLIGPGLALVGIGLLLMAGLNASSHWTHLIPGFIIAGLGSGIVNPPLASAAVGVVPPSRAHLATLITTSFVAGINDLLIITAIIALLGATFSLWLIRSKDFVHTHAQPMPSHPTASTQPARQSSN